MKKLHLNSLTSAIYQIVTIIAGLVVPKEILSIYGSNVYGLVSSITQMLGFISFLELGIGVVMQVSLYKPLAEKDMHTVSLIYHDAQKYFNLIGKVLCIYIFVLCFYYGIFKSDLFSYTYTTTLIIAISINCFTKYYFGLSNTLLLNADQKIYISTYVNLITTVANVSIVVFMMECEVSIQLVQLTTSLIFLLRPLVLYIYVKQNYNIDYNLSTTDEVLKNKWSAATQHISGVMNGVLDYIVLTMFSTFQLLAVYSVYVMPLTCIRSLVISISSGYKSYFGNIIAREDYHLLLREFSKYELVSHFFVAIAFGSTMVLIVPFVTLYTNGVNDTNYADYLFAILITVAYAIYSLQLPYISIIFSAGHFRQTQFICIGECVINGVLSVVLVKFMGIVGVAIGTIIAVLFRLIASAIYLKSHILFRGVGRLFALLIIDSVCVLFIYNFASWIGWPIYGYADWVLYSIVILIGALIIACILFKMVFGKEFYIPDRFNGICKLRGKR